MIHTKSLLLVTVSIAALASSGEARQVAGGVTAGRRTAAPAVPGQLVLRTVPGSDVAALIAGTGATIVESNLAEDTYLLDVPLSAMPSVASELAAHPASSWIEPNALVAPPEAPGCGLPADFSPQQCTIAIFDGDPSPETYFDQPTVPIINVRAAQALSTGSPSLVAVVDTGIDLAHDIFMGRLASSGYDFVLDQPVAWDVGNGIDDDGDGLVDEAWGHGTHIAGIVALINPDAFILPLRVLDSDGNGSVFNVALAIHYALDSGADVINLSLGMTGYSQVVDDALERAKEMEVTVIAAAGNTGSLLVLYPANRESVLAVAALDVDDTKAPFSAYGEAVEFSAPGVDVYSAMPGNMWAWWSGTSMATAVSSGAVSLLHSVDGVPAFAEGGHALEETCVDIDGVNDETYDDLLGEGRIDVEAGAWEILEPDDD